MKRLLVAAALAPLSFAAAAHAQTTISSATTTPLATSTSGDVTVSSTGSITPTTSASTPGPVAVTIDSNNSVDNEGAISITETVTGDTTNQGITAGPFANGSDRFGILVAPGGPYTGDITNGTTGVITVDGENSAGISLESGLNGSINDTGTISVTGGNDGTGDVSYGIVSAANAPISGDVSIAGTLSATGANATGVALNGGVGGAVDINGAITVTGYHSTTAPDTVAEQEALVSSQLDQGGPAISIGGDVAGGLTIEPPVVASGNISAASGGVVAVYGSAPGLLVGGAAPVTIGAGADGYAVTVAGSISTAGTYPGFNGEGIQIGGVNGLAVNSGGAAPGSLFGNVSLAGGIDISGSLETTAVANTTGGGGAATALEIGQGANVPRVTISGSVLAIGSNGLESGSSFPGAVTAIQVDQGAPVGATTLTNSGNITAEVTGIAGVVGVTQSSGGIVGAATAISDAGGGLSQITNTGNITAAVIPAVSGTTPEAASTATAIFADNSAPLTITQCSALDSGGACAISGNATLTPNIIGAINLSEGSGAQTLNLWGGNITGAIEFGNSTSNAFDIENGGLAKGALTVATNGQLALNVNKGELFMTTPTLVPLSTLHIGDGGSVIFTGDPGNPNGNGFAVAGTATLDDGSAVGLALASPLTGPETFTVITANNLVAGNVSTALLGQIPYLENGNITTTATTLSINASPKTAAELGLNPAEAAMFPAFSKAYGSDADVAADVLSKLNRASFLHVYDQFLPDYSGGPFETLVTGQQDLARAEAEAPVKLQTDTVRGWVQEIGFSNNEATTSQVNGYQGLGFGFAGGVERARGDTALGVAASFITTGVQDDTQPGDQALSASAFEVGVYWRKGGEQPGLNANASLNGGLVTMGSHRYLIDQTNSTDLDQAPTEIVSREAKASWLGGIVSADVGVGYQFDIGKFFARPEVSADYNLLSQMGYKEHGGGTAFNLDIAQQTASQADAQADLVMGMNFGQAVVWRPELTIGYRAVVMGGPTSTTANFEGGQSFTLDPNFTDKGGLLARLGLRASGQYADFSADAGGEFNHDYQSYDARAAARFLF